MQIILFDYDDTLVRTKQCKYAAIQAVASRHYGVHLTEETIDDVWGVAYRQLFRSLFGRLDSDLDRVIARYEALDDEFPIQPFDDTFPALQKLAARAHLGIVTSAARAVVQVQLKSLGFPADWFSTIQTADDTEFHKPDPRVFHPTKEHFRKRELDGLSITYVGDSLKDHAAAINAGFQFFGILRGTTSKQSFATAGAATIDTLDDLHELIGG